MNFRKHATSQQGCCSKHNTFTRACWLFGWSLLVFAMFDCFFSRIVGCLQDACMLSVKLLCVFCEPVARTCFPSLYQDVLNWGLRFLLHIAFSMKHFFVSGNTCNPLPMQSFPILYYDFVRAHRIWKDVGIFATEMQWPNTNLARISQGFNKRPQKTCRLFGKPL